MGKPSAMTEKLHIGARYFDDQEWGFGQYRELVVKYSNEWVAIVNKRVVSHGADPDVVEEQAAQSTGIPKDEIPLMYMEPGNQVF